MAQSPLSTQRMTRSPHGYLGGVCEGLGERFGVEPNLLRVGWLIATFIFGTGALLYIALWWLLPTKDDASFDATIWVNQGENPHPPLARTEIDKKILGVCGGLARRWELDATMVRLAALSLLVLTGPLAVLVYLVAAALIPGPDRLLERTSASPLEL